MTKQQPRRRNIRIATIVLNTPILFFGVLFALLRFTIFKEPPTLAELQREFSSKRADLEVIVRMSDEDPTFWRIAPDFLRSGDPSKPDAQLPATRWDAYRRIFSRTGIKLGLERDASHDVFIIVDSVGLLNRGHATGYVYCDSTAPPPNSYGFHPCALNQKRGHRDYDPRTRDEAYSFLKLDDHWYAYDEGPS